MNRLRHQASENAHKPLVVDRKAEQRRCSIGGHHRVRPADARDKLEFVHAEARLADELVQPSHGVHMALLTQHELPRVLSPGGQLLLRNGRHTIKHRVHQLRTIATEAKNLFDTRERVADVS